MAEFYYFMSAVQGNLDGKRALGWCLQSELDMNLAVERVPGLHWLMGVQAPEPEGEEEPPADLPGDPDEEERLSDLPGDSDENPGSEL
jgi:hypothetical protein